MKENKTIRNTSDLRKMLLETIEGVRSGSVDPKQANAIATLSSKVLQSARLDLEMMRFNVQNDEVANAGQKVLQLVSA